MGGNVNQTSSPYLAHRARLGDVIAAIQILGSFPWHAIRKEHWEQHFQTAKSTSDGTWDLVFAEHPEFFLVTSDGDVALRWRFAHQRTFDPRKGIDYTPEQRDAQLNDDEKSKLHRRPLSPDQVGALLKVAIELHTRDLAQAQDLRWRIPIIASFAGGLIGAILGTAGAIIAASIKAS
jgi:hypothetical protein